MRAVGKAHFKYYAGSPARVVFGQRAGTELRNDAHLAIPDCDIDRNIALVDRDAIRRYTASAAAARSCPLLSVRPTGLPSWNTRMPSRSPTRTRPKLSVIGRLANVWPAMTPTAAASSRAGCASNLRTKMLRPRSTAIGPRISETGIELFLAGGPQAVTNSLVTWKRAVAWWRRRTTCGVPLRLCGRRFTRYAGACCPLESSASRIPTSVETRRKRARSRA